jgi:Sec-independent protein secretion pathway component TatC
MISYLFNIPNRIKSIYLAWIFIHFILFLIGNLFEYDNEFFPFRYSYAKGNYLSFDISVYDYSELLIYILSPIVLSLVIKLWNKKDE